MTTPNESSAGLSQLRIDRSAAKAGRRRGPHWGLWATGAIVVAAGGAWLLSPRATPVHTAAVVTTTPSQQYVELTASGYVVAQRRAAVASKATGRLVELMVREGSKVKKGEVIARLDASDVQAAIAAAEAGVRQAEAGVRHFGENRVQEADAKYAGLREVYRDLKLHLIGPLQTNKARDALAIFDVIESVDRPELVDALVKGSPLESQRFYVQVNIGEEPQKAGIAPAEADAFIALARGTYGLTIEGLMCIPPVGADPAPYFASLRAIAARNGVEKLSMGMSDDFEIAIAEGATSVRVGSALFGDRHYG